MGWSGGDASPDAAWCSAPEMGAEDSSGGLLRMGIVNNMNKFIGATVREIRARLEGKDFLAGNWSLHELSGIIWSESSQF